MITLENSPGGSTLQWGAETDLLCLTSTLTMCVLYAVLVFPYRVCTNGLKQILVD